MGGCFGDTSNNQGPEQMMTRHSIDGTQPLLAGHSIEEGMPGAVRQEELIAALDEHAIVSIADNAGKIIYVNDLFCRTSGYTPFELLGSQHNIVRSWEHPPELYRNLNAVNRQRCTHARGIVIDPGKRRTPDELPPLIRRVSLELHFDDGAEAPLAADFPW